MVRVDLTGKNKKEERKRKERGKKEESQLLSVVTGDVTSTPPHRIVWRQSTFWKKGERNRKETGKKQERIGKYRKETGKNQERICDMGWGKSTCIDGTKCNAQHLTEWLACGEGVQYSGKKQERKRKD